MYACKGALYDHPNWRRITLSSILSIKKYDQQYKDGIIAIQYLHENGDLMPNMLLLQRSNVSSLSNFPHNDSSLSNSLNAMFCNYALLCFQGYQEDISTFLESLLPYLVECGKVKILVTSSVMLIFLSFRWKWLIRILSMYAIEVPHLLIAHV